MMHLIVAPGRGPDMVAAEERQLLREDLLQRPVRREEPVAQEDRLLAVADHLPLHVPVVVDLLLLAVLRADRRGGGERQRGGAGGDGQQSRKRSALQRVPNGRPPQHPPPSPSRERPR